MRPGYKKTEVGVIPEMWDVASIDMLTSRATGVWGSNVQDERHSHLVEIIRAGDISQDGRLTSTAIRYVSPKELEKAKCSFDDLVITTSGNGLGKLWWCDGRENTAASNFVRVLHPFPSKANGRFLAYALRTNEGMRQLKEHTATSAYPNLRPTYFSTRWVSLPHLAEQIAIATVLSDMDELLGGLDRLIAKKRDLKQAAMQQLLTGQTRLPGFHGEWEVRRLGGVASVSKGTQLHSSEANEGGKFAHLNGGITPSSYTNKSNTAGNTIAISEGGNSCGFVQFMQEPYWCGGHCYSVIPNGADNHFLYHALKGQQSAIMALRVGSGLPNVQKTGLLDFKISIPETLPEQTAIATVLTTMDAELAGLEQQRAKTAAIKQGMMQELLTGRIRLVEAEALHA